MAHTYDTVIVGAGPAGAAAALYCARAGWRTVVLDRGPTTGTTAALKHIVDYPGTKDSVSGEAFVKRMRWQARDAGADFREATIDNVALANSGRMLFTKEGKKYDARSVILATGCVLPESLIPGEKEFLGAGVSYSSWQDGAAYRKKPVAVYGKCEAAAEAALALSATCSAVHFIIPSSKIDLTDKLEARLKKARRISRTYSASVKAILGEETVTGVTTLTGGHEENTDVAAVFLYHHEAKPDLSYLGNTVEIGKHGGILVDDTLQTSIRGVFAAGDCVAATLQTQIISVAQGVMAANAVNEHLKRLKR